MDLLRTLTNPEFDGLATSLTQRMRSGPSARSSPRPHPPPRRARYGSIERSVLQVLEQADRPMTVAEVCAQIERQLGGALSYGSVKASLSRLNRGASPVVKRIRRSTYRLE